MQRLDKFYSDIIRSSKSSKKSLGERFLSAVKNYDNSLESFAEDLLSHWEKNYKEQYSAEESAEFFYKLFSFITNEFSKEQNFSADEWQALYDSVIAAEDELDLGLLEGYFSIFLDRGIIE